MTAFAFIFEGKMLSDGKSVASLTT